MAVLSCGWSTLPDLIFGSFVLIIGILAIVLNPFIFLNTRGSKENPNLFVYKILALNDFLTSLVGAFHAAYYVLKTEDPYKDPLLDAVEQHLEPCLTPWQWFHGITFRILSVNPCYICFVANLLKFMAVVFPLRKLTVVEVHVLSA